MPIIRTGKRLINKCKLIVVLLFTFVITNACTDSEIIIETFPLLIYQVNEINFSIPAESPDSLQVTAHGLASSSGWSNPVLVPKFGIDSPPNGIYEFEFKAVPPEEASTTNLQEITASYLFDTQPAELLAVRVFAEQNEVIKYLEDNAPLQAYFEFGIANETDRFVIKLQDDALIQHARDLLAGKTQENPSIMGEIVKSPADYNSAWSYHLAPESIIFFETAVEVCDASMRYIEEHLVEVGDTLLPNNTWCSWGSELIRELDISELNIN